MAETVFGLFEDRKSAEDAVEELKSNGYDAKDISIIMRDEKDSEVVTTDTGESVADGAATGAVTGGVIGGLAGLLVGIGAITIPGIGAILIGGPLAALLGLTGVAATTVSGAATGALAGGLVGALIGLGVPEEDARVYEESVKSGGILLAVPTRDDASTDAKSILQDHGAGSIRTVTMKTG